MLAAVWQSKGKKLFVSNNNFFIFPPSPHDRALSNRCMHLLLPQMTALIFF
jgi:hypothetical protein